MNQQQPYGKSFGGSIAENYQRFFVPAIGAPVAKDLLAIADLKPGERVLDVACGTGVVTRMAAERAGIGGPVAGLDINPAMLAVAGWATPSEMSIAWLQGNAESMPVADCAFDVVLCQMGLQFVPGKLEAAREMRRVLESGGRAIISLPGPKPRLFEIMTDGLAHHLSPQAASFADLVFSMHDAGQLEELLRSAGFRQVEVTATSKSLRLPPPADFLWQYIHSTPLAAAVAQAGEAKRAALERDVCGQWQEFVVDGHLSLEVRVMTATAVNQA